MPRAIALAYGGFCYVAFFLTFLYAIGFLANLVVPKSIDSGVPGPLGAGDRRELRAARGVRAAAQRHGAAGLQARVDAGRAEAGRARDLRARQQRRDVVALRRCGSRSRPWSASFDGLAGAMLTGLFFLGYRHGALLDLPDRPLRPVRAAPGGLSFQGKPYTEKSFSTPSLYQHVRHPLYVGWMMTFWSTPQMSVGHLLFATR